MELPPLLLQTAGSLVAILALAGLAWWLGLGDAPILAGEDAARQAAGEVEDGFAPVATVVSSGGDAALARDAQERIMLIRRHGNRFAGRILDAAAQAREQGDMLVVDTGEARFGKVALNIPEPGAWAASINALNPLHHA